jgi:hypothetical protein
MTARPDAPPAADARDIVAELTAREVLVLPP